MRFKLGKVARVEGRTAIADRAHDHWYRPPDVEGATSIKKIFGQLITAKFERGCWRVLFRAGHSWLSYQSEYFDDLWREVHSDCERAAKRYPHLHDGAASR